MPAPSSTLDWTEGNPDQATIAVEPGVAKKEAGWFPNEKPTREHLNWMFQNIDEWLKYLNQKVTAQDNQFDAIVANDGSETHSTLAAALADVSVPAGARIYIKKDETVNTAIQVNKNNIHLIFKNGVTFSKGSATHALELNADRVRVEGGRFTGFNGGGDCGVKILAGADWCSVHNCYFLNNTQDVNDIAGTANVQMNHNET